MCANDTPAPDSALIETYSGHLIRVDAADYEALSRYTWTAHRSSSGPTYATRMEPLGGGKQRMVFMHRELLGLTHGDERCADHINGDGLDNRRSNLREATVKENSWNRGPFPGSSSRFKGVSWLTSKRRWAAAIHRHGKTTPLGWYRSELEAALAYNVAAAKNDGRFARLNDLSPLS